MNNEQNSYNYSIDPLTMRCIRNLSEFEGITADEWIKSVIETAILEGSGHTSIRDYALDCTGCEDPTPLDYNSTELEIIELDDKPRRGGGLLPRDVNPYGDTEEVETSEQAMIYNTKIADFRNDLGQGIPQNIVNCLFKNRINSMGTLLSCSEKDLLDVVSFGKKKLADLKEVLDGSNLPLGQDLQAYGYSKPWWMKK